MYIKTLSKGQILFVTVDIYKIKKFVYLVSIKFQTYIIEVMDSGNV